MVKYLDDSGVVREIVEDGESIRCPVHLMDATQKAMYLKYETWLPTITGRTIPC